MIQKLSPKRRAKFCEEILAGAESVNWLLCLNRRSMI